MKYREYNLLNGNFRLLSEEQAFGYLSFFGEKPEIDVIREKGTLCAISDFAILLGGYVCDDHRVFDDNSLKGRTCEWYLLSHTDYGSMHSISEIGVRDILSPRNRFCGVRPVISYFNIRDIFLNVVSEKKELLEVEYGEYPQYAVDASLAKILNNEFAAGRLRKTGKTYTTDSKKWDAHSKEFSPIEHEEFSYNGKKYVRVKSNCYEKGYELSNGVRVMPGDYVWVEVAPITWLLGKRSRLMLSKTCLASGIRFCNDREYKGDFKNTEMYMFLNKYFARDIVPSVIAKEEQKDISEKEKKSEITEPIDDKEIMEVVNKILSIASNLANKEIIIDKVSKLLNEYLKDKEDLKPTYGEEKSFFNDNLGKNIKSIKPILLSELSKILNSLTLKENIVKFLFNLNGYLKLFELNIDKLTEENNSTEDMIKNIIYLSNGLNDKNKNKFISKLKGFINESINKASAEIEKMDDIILNANNHDYEMELKLNISKLYEEVSSLYNKINPFKELLDALKNDKEIYKPPQNNNVKDTINGIRYVLPKLSNGVYKEDISSKFNKIIEKYTILIEKYFNNEEELSSANYEKIEKELRTELSEILEVLNKYAYLDKYEVEKADEINILEQLSRCIEIIKEGKIVKNKEQYKLQPVTSYIADLYNKILNSELLDKKTKEKITSELLSTINESLNEIKDKDTIKTLKDYNKVVIETLKKFAKTEFKIISYVQNVNEYNKFTK